MESNGGISRRKFIKDTVTAVVGAAITPQLETLSNISPAKLNPNLNPEVQPKEKDPTQWTVEEMIARPNVYIDTWIRTVKQTDDPDKKANFCLFLDKYDPEGKTGKDLEDVIRRREIIKVGYQVYGQDIIKIRNRASEMGAKDKHGKHVPGLFGAYSQIECLENWWRPLVEMQMGTHGSKDSLDTALLLLDQQVDYLEPIYNHQDYQTQKQQYVEKGNRLFSESGLIEREQAEWDKLIDTQEKDGKPINGNKYDRQMKHDYFQIIELTRAELTNVITGMQQLEFAEGRGSFDSSTDSLSNDGGFYIIYENVDPKTKAHLVSLFLHTFLHEAAHRVGPEKGHNKNNWLHPKDVLEFTSSHQDMLEAFYHQIEGNPTMGIAPLTKDEIEELYHHRMWHKTVGHDTLRTEEDLKQFNQEIDQLIQINQLLEQNPELPGCVGLEGFFNNSSGPDFLFWRTKGIDMRLRGNSLFPTDDSLVNFFSKNNSSNENVLHPQFSHFNQINVQHLKELQQVANYALTTREAVGGNVTTLLDNLIEAKSFYQFIHFVLLHRLAVQEKLTTNDQLFRHVNNYEKLIQDRLIHNMVGPIGGYMPPALEISIAEDPSIQLMKESERARMQTRAQAQFLQITTGEKHFHGTRAPNLVNSMCWSIVKIQALRAKLWGSPYPKNEAYPNLARVVLKQVYNINPDNPNDSDNGRG
jgi:hypothetical protein